MEERRNGSCGVTGSEMGRLIEAKEERNIKKGVGVTERGRERGRGMGIYIYRATYRATVFLEFNQLPYFRV